MSTMVNDCPRCGAGSITFDIMGDYRREQRQSLPYHEFMCRCRHCDQSSIAIMVVHNSAYDDRFRQSGSASQEPGNILNFFTFVNFASLANGPVIASPEYLPSAVEQCFREGAVCFSVRCHNAAGAMFRLCLDMATKQLLPDESTAAGPNQSQRKKLYDRLEWLFSNGTLPSSLRDLAECVRQDGNDGAHDGTLTQADTEDLIDFSRILLERVYTEPERLRLANERRTARRAG